MSPLEIIQNILIYGIPILFAITVHEVAHGWIANLLGDPTARVLGRLTLNPIKHIDLIGTILVPAVLYFVGGFIFGWAKPVPIGWRNLRSPRRDIALVAGIGPFSNLIMAIIWALIIKGAFALFVFTHSGISIALMQMGEIGIQINLVLMVLNLIPIPPLDGSRVVTSLLPPALAVPYSRIEPFGFFILLILLSLGILGAVLAPVVSTLAEQLATLLALPHLR